MEMFHKAKAIEYLNDLGRKGVPFQFYCDFLGERWVIEPIHSLRSFQLSLSRSAATSKNISAAKKDLLSKRPLAYSRFKKAFDEVLKEINTGNSFLTNLTFRTRVESSHDLGEMFQMVHAKYKLYVPDKLLVFSPETFVKIVGNRIQSNPMKGTIDAELPEADQVILNNEKEMAEHVTIVDLIRNDLSQIAANVRVSRFRYIDKIKTNAKSLLQVSSQIEGQLESNWKTKLGTILATMLPAGSISGAPKAETVRIIRRVETEDRGFYTGVCGEFDGEKLDTGVMIRCLQKDGNQLFYHSGGGITFLSDPKTEYQEIIDKIYLPVG